MTPTVPELRKAAARARRLVVRMVRAGGSGHVGGALSAIELITVLYFATLNVDPQRPLLRSRDRFLLSAGHKAMAQYAVLALAGFFPTEVLDTYGSLGTCVGGHPDMHKLPGIEANTGALGHGLPIACGMAFGARMAGLPSRVFVVMGDGELPEGSNWEAASIAAHHHLDNLVVFVDENGLQISGPTREVLDMNPITEKFRAFGWGAEVIDGHSLEQIIDVLQRIPLHPGRPTAIIARTVKARGVSGIEGTVPSHYWKPTQEDLARVEYELDLALTALEQDPAR